MIALFASIQAGADSAETGTLVGRVVDSETRGYLPCRIHLTGSDGKSYVPATGEGRDVVVYQKQRGESVSHHATIGPAPFRAELPAGRASVTIERGKEYIPLTKEIDIVAGRETLETFSIERWIDMAGRGWYSGDTHVHRTLAELPNVMLAENLNVAFPLEQWVREAYQPPAYKPAPGAERARDQLVRIDDTHLFHVLNCEYEIFTVGKKSWTLGAIMFLNAGKPFAEGAPPIGPIAEAGHRDGALIDLDKHNWPWSMMLVPVAKVDLYELANNHMWRAKPFFLTWGEPAPDYLKTPATARGWALYGFGVYYTLLDCGFRIAPSAGTASGVHPVPLGWSRVYSKVDGAFSYDKWLESLRKGRSFVTNGPMLFLTVDGVEPGGELKSEGKPVRVRVDLEYVRPVETVEIVVNGQVAKIFDLDTSIPADQPHKASLEHVVDPKDHGNSCWVAARCFEMPIPDNFRFAHTGPVYIQHGNEPIRPRKEEIDFLISRVEAELERNRGTLRPEDLAEYEKALEVYRGIAKRARTAGPVSSNSTTRPATRQTAAQESPSSPVRAKAPASDIEEFTRRLEDAQRAYARLKDYKAVFYEEERIRGKLQPAETFEFKFRKPFSVYFMPLDGPDKGTRVVYIDGENENRLLVRETGLLSLKLLRLDPKGYLAMKRNRHAVEEAGIGNLIRILDTNRKRAVAEGRAKVRRLPDDPRARPRGPRYELTITGEKTPGYYCHRAIVTFDSGTGLLSAVRVYDWDNQLLEDYRFLDLEIDVGLTDEDFRI